MQVKAIIQEKYKETEIHICADQRDDKIDDLVEEISEYVNPVLYATDTNGNKKMIPLMAVVRIYSENQKVFLGTEQGVFSVSKKLYELEEELGKRDFVRISKSEMVNMKKIQKLDMSLSGTIRISMKDGSESYASRRNVAKIKQALGLTK